MSATRARRFHQLDVFTVEALRGNPLAVVHDAAGLDDERMAALARWTNLSETTFLLPPEEAGADYRVRIWTPGGELPFAGHPTLGSCWAWLAAGGRPHRPGEIVQQCGVGLVRVRRDGARLAFAAPPRRRSGPLDEALLDRICAGLGIARSDVLHHAWADNGPGWCAVMLPSAAQVIALVPQWPRLAGIKLGVVGRHDAGHDATFELRAFVGGGNYEDPVTGSLNASVAQWLIGERLAPAAYVAAQGTALRRAGRVHVRQEGGEIWIGGDVTPCVEGTIAL